MRDPAPAPRGQSECFVLSIEGGTWRQLSGFCFKTTSVPFQSIPRDSLEQTRLTEHFRIQLPRLQDHLPRTVTIYRGRQSPLCFSWIWHRIQHLTCHLRPPTRGPHDDYTYPFLSIGYLARIHSRSKPSIPSPPRPRQTDSRLSTQPHHLRGYHPANPSSSKQPPNSEVNTV